MQLFIKRVKVVSSSGKHALLHLDPSFMSDREDEGSQTGSWIGRSPLWCSPELISLLKKLQGKVDSQSGSSHPENSRLHGEPSTCPLPPTCTSPAATWALHTLDRDSDPRDNHYMTKLHCFGVLFLLPIILKIEIPIWYLKLHLVLCRSTFASAKFIF